MSKKSVLILSSLLLLSLSSCGPNEAASSSSSAEPSEASSASAYEKWRDSDDAQDLNGDRKITEDDYVIWVAYSFWRGGAGAYDFNGDLVINYKDYEVYLQFETWKKSANAKDWNGDGKIDISDYTVYLSKGEFIGTYTLTNYQYVGDNILLTDSEIQISRLGAYIDGFSVTVDSDGKFMMQNVSKEAVTDLSSEIKKVYELLDNATMTRLSKSLVSLDSFFYQDTTKLNFTLYLIPTETGFTTGYTIKTGNYSGKFTLDIVKSAA